MNKFFLLIVFIAWSGMLMAQDKLFETYNCHFINTPLPEFISELEQELGVTFYYKSEWLRNSSVSVNGDSLPLKRILEQAFKYTRLSYLFEEPNNIILIEKQNQYSISLAMQPTQLSDDENGVSKINDGEFLQGRRTDEKKKIIVGEKNKTAYNKKVRVKGNIVSSEDNEPLIGANLYFPAISLGAATNEHGEIHFRLYPGTYSGEFSCIGMATEKCQFEVFGDGTFSFAMQKEVTAIDEVTVNANQVFAIRGSQVGLDKIDIKSVKELPSLMGERDIVKISQLLPGVVSVNEGSGGINVRGGNADQNLFYVNKVPLYNTSHVFGFFTAVNPSVISDFSMYKGYVPTQFGGRLSSLFLLETRAGNKKNLFAQGGISPISANIEIEGPIIKEKSSFVVSGRSSYSDWIMNRLNDEDLQNSNVKFSDFTASIDYEFDENRKVKLFGYKSSDYFNLNNLNKYNYNNLGAALNYFHRYSSTFKAEYAAVYSAYGFKSEDWNSISESYSHEYQIQHTELKGNYSWNFTEKQLITFGGSVINYALDRGKILPVGEQSERQESLLGKEYGIEGALYVDDSYQITKKLKIQAGARLSYFAKLGPGEVLTYAPDVKPDISNVINTEAFKAGKIMVDYTRPELRFSADYKFSSFSSLKLAYNEMSQYLFLLSNTYAVAPTDQWKMADSYIKPGFSRQMSLGYYQVVPSLGISLSTEAYLKKMENILEFADGADFLENKQVETMTLQGEQDAYGLEFMLAKESGRLNGWLTYTYSRSQVKVDGENSWEKINQGAYYPSNYDKPHVVNIVGNYRFNRRLVLSANVLYSTGRPITMPKAIYFIEGSRYIDYSDRNEYRVPDNFRLDLSLTLEGNLKAKKFLHSYWVFNVYNVTGRKNPYSIYFHSENGVVQGYKYSIIGVPIFTVSWNFKLGNYEND
ncbi:MAG: TonB-dependent receptor [Salinivirgaceae bacterium]